MTSPPTGLLGVGLGGDNSPRMIAVQLKVEFFKNLLQLFVDDGPDADQGLALGKHQ